MKNQRPIIFCDFDGTFAEKDIGYRIFRHFSGGANDSLVTSWKKGQITSRECLIKEAQLIKITTDELFEFVDQFQLRAGAEEFYRATIKNNIPFYILSDGINLYIDQILEKYQLAEIKYFSNRASIKNDRMTIEFPHDNYNCPRCGCCKGARIKDIVGDDRSDRQIIYIGDGLSDICAVDFADLIFARGDFLKYCHQIGKVAVEYTDFFDILEYLGNTGIISGRH